MILVFRTYYSNKLDKQYDFDYIFESNIASNRVYNIAVNALVQGLILNNESSWVVTYGQISLSKTEYVFMHPNCLFAECIYNIFDMIDKSEGDNTIK